MDKYNEEHKTEIAARAADWHSENADQVNARKVQWRKDNDEKVRAHRSVYNALRNGMLVKPEVCDVCGLELPLEAHHDDYSKPLMVMWLCRSCHLQRHRL